MNIYPASIYKLQRLGFLNNDNELTASGESLLANQFNIPPTEKVAEVYMFEEFWNAFPKDDEHHIFNKTRAIRANKALARLEYDKLINEGVASQIDLIEAVKREVKWRMSFKTENHLKFMKSPPNWLRDKMYLEEHEIDIKEKDIEDYGKNVI